MKIYLSHSSNFDYVNDLYQPLKSSSLVHEHQITFPHDKSTIGSHSKDLIAHADLVLAEVSHPSTGQGIELGWADDSSTPILCIYKAGSKISNSLRFITNDFAEYKDQDDMLGKLSAWLATKN